MVTNFHSTTRLTCGVLGAEVDEARRAHSRGEDALHLYGDELPLLRERAELRGRQREEGGKGARSRGGA